MYWISTEGKTLNPGSRNAQPCCDRTEQTGRAGTLVSQNSVVTRAHRLRLLSGSVISNSRSSEIPKGFR